MTIEKDTEQEFIDLINEVKNEQKETKPQPIKITALSALIITCIFLFLYFGTSLFSSQEPTGPWGRIKNPVPGSTTTKEVSVTAETKNIGVGQYVWLVVDKPNLGLCWPKKPRIKPNTKFKTTIIEGGPKESYRLSLYAVNQTINGQWQDWIDRKIFGGLPMLPDRKRLDSVMLVLKD